MERTNLDIDRKWRHDGAMKNPSGIIADLDRANLRLSTETFRAIDAACAARPGRISRNTWITEAIEEKLAREQFPKQTAATEKVRNA